MSTPTIFLGLALIAISGVSYGLSEAKSLTAFIPAAFGVVFILLGFLAKKGPKANKIAMHIAVVVAAVLVFPTPRSGIWKLVDAVRGNTELPIATWSQGITAALALVYFILCVRSFIRARKAGGME